MVDDELTTTGANEFRGFQACEVGRERRSRIKEWLVTLICWDAFLPIAVLSIPNLVAFLFPNWQLAIAMLAVFVPVAALCARFLFGWKRMRRGQAYIWQMIVFTIGISALFLFEAFLLNDQVGPGPKIADPTTLLMMFLMYIATMALALYPFRLESASASLGDVPGQQEVAGDSALGSGTIP